MKQKIHLNSFSPIDKQNIEPKQDEFRKNYQELTILTYLQYIIMPMFPCFKLADFLPEVLKGIIIDTSTYINIKLKKFKSCFTIYHTILNINDPGKEGLWKHCRKGRKY